MKATKNKKDGFLNIYLWPGCHISANKKSQEIHCFGIDGTYYLEHWTELQKAIKMCVDFLNDYPKVGKENK